MADPPAFQPAHGERVVDGGRFEHLFAQFYPEFYGLVYRVLGERMETEDALQETFLKLSADSHIQSRPDGEVGAWLRRVALNVTFNRLRTERRARSRLERVGRLELPREQQADTDPGSPAGLLVRREEQAAVRQALTDVPERQRECLLLRYSGYSYAEIALTVDVAVGSVGVLLARAEKAFRASYRRQSQS